MLRSPDTNTSIVVIPTCNRPEFLALCLRRLSEAPGCPEVYIYADTAAKLNQIEQARDLYFPTATVFHAKAHIAAPSGCWNILNSIKEGSRWAENVFFVEEDVMVYPYYFDWHSRQTAPASCGRRYVHNQKVYPFYTNPGSCLRRPLLDKLVPHISDEYFQDTVAYCEKNFSTHHSSTLDDGLIRRVIDQNQFEVKFPEAPVCAHQGWRMYGRADIYQNEGVTLEQRVANLETMIQRVKPSDRYAHDFESFEPTPIRTD